MAMVAEWSIKNGQYQRLLYGADSWDNICGFDNSDRNDQLISNNARLDMTDRPHQYYTDPSDRKGVRLEAQFFFLGDLYFRLVLYPAVRLGSANTRTYTDNNMQT